jgi:hypothetical protein
MALYFYRAVISVEGEGLKGQVFTTILNLSHVVARLIMLA